MTKAEEFVQLRRREMRDEHYAKSMAKSRGRGKRPADEQKRSALSGGYSKNPYI